MWYWIQRLIFQKKAPSLRNILPNIDYTKPIQPVEDKYLDWLGKEDGRPKPEIIWFQRDG